ncbi:TetR/AcrR family transcriptional regulator [Herbiconiux ginsengi]|uniref:Transcriptional regulator, TetR family n=1 Tax=Herbiconiux ginsengi TaxID=381665 RepID=A0A1H3RMD7_9MICO|nr:TetR/AcrR family transcriptional regulator [Herbiconiux ginsengi]SDZ26388.1 transcriptional regulator, TetR family [Herbiconiux ginsengi]
MADSVEEQPAVKRRDAQRTRESILRAATAEFADNGFAGGRVDEIAAQTATTKRMIYYYFRSKEGLYLAVMESAYAVIRRLEQDLDVDGLDPVDALRSLAESTYDHHTSHRDFVRLVAIENVHRAEHIRHSGVIRDLNSTAVQTLERVLGRGVAAGVFRSDIDALDVHMMISAYSVFHVANRYTFRVLFERDLLDVDRNERYRRLAGDMIVATMTAPVGPRVSRG